MDSNEALKGLQWAPGTRFAILLEQLEVRTVMARGSKRLCMNKIDQTIQYSGICDG